MAQGDKHERPIIHLVKKVDHLLAMEINKVHAAHDVTHQDWQIMNTLAEQGSCTEAYLLNCHAGDIDAAGIDESLNRLVGRGWAKPAGHEVGSAGHQLTEVGRQHHHRISEIQVELRVRALEGISSDEYEVALHVLEQIVENLAG